MTHRAGIPPSASWLLFPPGRRDPGRARVEGGVARVSVRIGAFLPTFGGNERRTGPEIADFARRAEELGLDSLWATDHLLHGSVFYGVPWLDPILSLTYASAVTTRVRLGTSYQSGWITSAQPPLSEKNSTSVFCSTPRSLSAARMRPMPRSIRSAIALRAPT